LASDLAFEDVDVEIAGKPLLRLGFRVKRVRIDTLARPAVENLGEVLHCCRLDCNACLIGGVDECPRDSFQAISEDRGVGQAAGLLVSYEKPHLSGKPQKGVLERGCWLSRYVHYCRLKCRESERAPAGGSLAGYGGRHDGIEVQTAACCDRGEIPQNVPELLDDSFSVSDVGCPISLFFLDLAE